MSGRRLTGDQIARFARDGFLCPIDALAPEDAAALVARLESFEGRRGKTLGKLPGQVRAKTHLLLPWLADLVRDPRVVEPVASLLGPNLLVYHVTCWLKEPSDASFVSWHQDGTYFHLNPPEHVTAWVALTDSRPESGCVRVIPGSHRTGQLEHGTRPNADNLLSNGQHVLHAPDEASATPLVLTAGQVSLHDTFLVHASGPNRTNHRRIGIGISYIPTRVRYRSESRVTATLARGGDRFGHFAPEPAPAAEMDDASVRFHAEACHRFFHGHGYSRRDALRQEAAPGAT